MSRAMSTAAVLLLSTLAAPLLGCQSTGARFLNLIGLGKRPLVVAVSTEPPAAGEPLALLNPYARYDELRKELGRNLGRPVVLESCFPGLLEPNLASGFYDVAILSPTDYARLGNPNVCTVIALPSDEKQRVMRPALLVVAADSEITQPADLRGKRVAFGPAEDARLHHAALHWLETQGIKPGELAIDLLPVPGRKHLPDSLSIARSVVSGDADAGFVDLRDWEALPDQADSAKAPDRRKLRVVARTDSIPDRLVVCSQKLSAEQAASVAEFFLQIGQRHPNTLRPLAIAGYAAPTPEAISACDINVAASTGGPGDSAAATAGDATTMPQ